MNSKALFSMALNLQSPWYIKDVKLNVAEGEMFGCVDLYIDFTKGYKFQTKSGKLQTAHDTVERSWRHLNFFQHECYIHARIPRVKDGDTIETIQVPWARKGSGFTMMFEALSMLMIEFEMPVSRVAKLLGEWDNRIWHIFSYWTNSAIADDEQDTVTNIGIDETSTKKGHNYVTVAVDMDEKRVIFATEGKDSKCLDKLKDHLAGKNCRAEQIKNISIDMSPAFISGSIKNFPNADITFDKFHVVKIINEAMDEVRKAESKEIKDLKGHKYLFLKKDSDLSIEQQEVKFHLLEGYPKLGEAYRLKKLFADFWEMKSDQAESFLCFWCDQTEDSAIRPFIKAAATIKAHFSGIINHIKTKYNNGILEGLNTKIQLARKRARGYRNINNFINMIYFTTGKLKFGYPLYLT